MVVSDPDAKYRFPGLDDIPGNDIFPGFVPLGTFSDKGAVKVGLVKIINGTEAE